MNEIEHKAAILVVKNLHDYLKEFIEMDGCGIDRSSFECVKTAMREVERFINDKANFPNNIQL
jgi:hypothetical protein